MSDAHGLFGMSGLKAVMTGSTCGVGRAYVNGQTLPVDGGQSKYRAP